MKNCLPHLVVAVITSLVGCGPSMTAQEVTDAIQKKKSEVLERIESQRIVLKAEIDTLLKDGKKDTAKEKAKAANEKLLSVSQPGHDQITALGLDLINKVGNDQVLLDLIKMRIDEAGKSVSEAVLAAKFSVP